ncbi:hypothetical protein JCM19039_4256 [Geomicrobium sp. JCM 19039]|nr:hypothetical protein JCM19039_4256 [Geomicrobium sp. JCM 19039]
MYNEKARSQAPCFFVGGGVANFAESEYFCVEWVHSPKNDLYKLNKRTSLNQMTEMGLCG